LAHWWEKACLSGMAVADPHGIASHDSTPQAPALPEVI